MKILKFFLLFYLVTNLIMCVSGLFGFHVSSSNMKKLSLEKIGTNKHVYLIEKQKYRNKEVFVRFHVSSNSLMNEPSYLYPKASNPQSYSEHSNGFFVKRECNSILKDEKYILFSDYYSISGGELTYKLFKSQTDNCRDYVVFDAELNSDLISSMNFFVENRMVYFGVDFNYTETIGILSTLFFFIPIFASYFHLGNFLSSIAFLLAILFVLLYKNEK